MGDKNEWMGSLSDPWRNDSCLGYASMAMEQANIPKRTISKVLDEMIWLFDSVSVEEAAQHIHYGNGVMS